jgi:membrane-bound lytic murein transglycosylase B
MRFLCFALTLFVFSGFHTNNAAAQTISFDQWVVDARAEALSKGISEATVNAAFQGLTPNQRVIELDRKQPEGTMTFARYRERIVNQTRIDKGREMFKKHADKLSRLEEIYGVQPQYVMALWGIETNFGGNTGGMDVIRSLSTLAWEGRRAEFFRGELMDALRIIDQGHISRDEMTGSWAGALGQVQFMPSSFKRLAIDGNNDGRKDIWNDLDDAFASAANYLVKNGWHAGERWGREVILPSGFDQNLVTTNTREPIEKSLAQWQAIGLQTMSKNPIPVVDDMDGYIVMPDDAGGPAYLVYNNYSTIMRWNRSTYFATSVGLLADAIAQ